MLPFSNESPTPSIHTEEKRFRPIQHIIRTVQQRAPCLLPRFGSWTNYVVVVATGQDYTTTAAHVVV